jgi:hypothetical protein
LPSPKCIMEDMVVVIRPFSDDPSIQVDGTKCADGECRLFNG